MFSVVHYTCVLIPIIYCVLFVRADSEILEVCDWKYNSPEWIEVGDDTFPAPAKAAMGLRSRNRAVVQVKDRKENVTLSLYALPQDPSNHICSPAKDIYVDLRKFHSSHTFIKGEDEMVFKYFYHIFTGCYYLKLTNSEGTEWIYSGRFFKTTYHYYDTHLYCKSNIEPARGDQSMQLIYELGLGLTCLSLRCQLFLLDNVTEKTATYLDNGSIPPSQDCVITHIKEGLQADVKCMRPDLSPQLVSVKPVIKYAREGWSTVVKWKNLPKNGAYYYLKYIRINRCYHLPHNDLTTWDSVVNVGAIILGFRNATDNEVPNTYFDSNMYVIGIILALILMVILIYWTLRYAQIVIKKRNELVDFETKPQIGDKENVRLNVKRKTDTILLIYAKGSPQFMTEMREFRNHLQNTCGTTVHDVYSSDDFSELAKLGVSKWVKQRLSEDSKIVWIDTPQFRSLFGRKQDLGANFRDNVIPYAVNLATDLFQDPASQYCHHFVVRLESLQVDNEHADPLLVISPHRRYFVPQHLGDLCEQLSK